MKLQKAVITTSSIDTAAFSLRLAQVGYKAGVKILRGDMTDLGVRKGGAMPSGKFLLGDARIVGEGDMNLLRVGAKYSVNIPSGIVTKPPKPGFVGFGSTHLGVIRNFLAEYFSVLPDGAIVVAIRLEGVVGPKKSLNDSSQGGGDVWYPLESGHQGDGIGVLGMSAYTTKRTWPAPLLD